MQKGQTEKQQCRGNSVTFTSSPGSDALSSGITLEEMWVGRIDGCTEAGR